MEIEIEKVRKEKDAAVTAKEISKTEKDSVLAQMELLEKEKEEIKRIMEGEKKEKNDILENLKEHVMCPVCLLVPIFDKMPVCRNV